MAKSNFDFVGQPRKLETLEALQMSVARNSKDPHFVSGQVLTISEDGVFEHDGETSYYSRKTGKEEKSRFIILGLHCKDENNNEEIVSITLFKDKSREDRSGEIVTNDVNNCPTDKSVVSKIFDLAKVGYTITYTTETYYNIYNRPTVIGVFTLPKAPTT